MVVDDVNAGGDGDSQSKTVTPPAEAAPAEDAPAEAKPAKAEESGDAPNVPDVPAKNAENDYLDKMEAAEKGTKRDYSTPRKLLRSTAFFLVGCKIAWDLTGIILPQCYELLRV